MTNEERLTAIIRHEMRPLSTVTREDQALNAACAVIESLGLERVTQERDMLAEAIGNAARKAGITAPHAQLTGPMLLMLCDDMAECIRSAVRVKPLKWSEPSSSVRFPEWHAQNVNLRLGYTIKSGEMLAYGKFALFLDLGGNSRWLSGHRKLESAKAAAQADHDVRIASALDLPPRPARKKKPAEA